MYLEFRLPQFVNSDHAIHIAITCINKDLESWQEKYGIQFRTKRHKFTYRVTFDDDKHYDFFALSWKPTSYASQKYSFVNPN